MSSQSCSLLLVGVALCCVIGGVSAQDAPQKQRPFGQLPKNFGWITPPDEEPEDLWEALTSGKISLNDRLRYEYANQDALRSSEAFTNRYRLGYMTKPYYGFSAMVEVESVQALNSESSYFVPAVPQGTPGRTTIADPEDVELNQWWGRYSSEEWGLEITGGRQRIIHDNHRFIGNVGWRQFEQTMDAGRVKTNLGLEWLELEYAYLWYIQRIFSRDGPNFDSDSHLVHAKITPCEEANIIPFVYLLDFDNDSPANSNNSMGVRLDGKIACSEDATLVYELTWAHQADAGDNPTDYNANYLGADAKLVYEDYGSCGAGYELLGSDHGNFGFRFPLGTNHAFNGWADAFLVTPAAGLQDVYGYVSPALPCGLKSRLVYHYFWTDDSTTSLGWEIDALLSKKINANLSVLVKAAFLEGLHGVADVNRLWVQTEFKF